MAGIEAEQGEVATDVQAARAPHSATVLHAMLVWYLRVSWERALAVRLSLPRAEQMCLCQCETVLATLCVLIAWRETSLMRDVIGDDLPIQRALHASAEDECMWCASWSRVPCSSGVHCVSVIDLMVRSGAPLIMVSAS